MEEDIIQKYTETVIKQIVKKDDEYTRKMIKEYVRTKYPNEKVRIDFYDEETIDKIIDLGINALKKEKTVHTCLHCGNDTPLYCEKCHQELISKNAKLQNAILNDKVVEKYRFHNESLQRENKAYKQYLEKLDELNSKDFVFKHEIKDDYIPKQVIRDKIQLLEKEIKLLDKNDKHTLIENDYIISILKELLGE